MASFDATSGPGVALRGDAVIPRRAPDDAALVTRARDGSAEAWRALFERHWDTAYRAAYLIVHDAAAAEDVAQEAFLSALAALDRFDRRRPFAPWLHRIAVNRAIDHVRSAARRRESPGDGSSEAAARPVVEQDGTLLAAIAALGPEQRAVVVMRYVLDWTPGEIARALKLPRGTVNSRLRRALDRLGEVLKEDLR
ncbi:MAG TPA: RNA polymerase sigma factor [Solirubrobacteraceae bacterium]|nr:RNA polymerase sigma factor [Solirubrobacteraceae bacterium]